MKKFIITSSIMKKAHAETRQVKRVHPEVNYHTQLGLEISKLLKEERTNYLHRKTIIKLNNAIKEVVKHDFYLSGNDITNVENLLRRETKLNRLYFPSAMTCWDLANYLVQEHFDKVRWI